MPQASTVTQMESRKESLIKFIESIEEKEVIIKEKNAENTTYLPEKNIPPINPQVSQKLVINYYYLTLEFSQNYHNTSKQLIYEICNFSIVGDILHHNSKFNSTSIRL